MRKLFAIIIVIINIFSLKVYAGERLSLGYIYATETSHIEIVEATRNSVNVVSPTYFDLSAKGRLKINNKIDERFVESMHEKGIKVTPFLSNHWERKRAQAALKNPENLVNDIVEAINKYNFDGINVDLENLELKDKDNLTNFVKLLRESLPKDKTLSVAVAANPENLEYSWLATYDYKNLAEYSDYLVLMAYDEHSYGGSEGTVAGIDFVEKSLQVILKDVSKDKVVLGIPLYGRFWKVGEDVGGEAIIIGQIPKIIKKYKLVTKYDEKAQTPKIKLTIKNNESGPYVNGRYLEEGTYNIYYENENSIRAKLELVNNYDILGTGLWALDNESSEFWDYYKDALNHKEYETEKEIELRKEHEMLVEIIIKQSFDRIHILPQSTENVYDASAEETDKKPNRFYGILLAIVPEKKKKKIKQV